jgi:cytoskeletal protein RodZ
VSAEIGAYLRQAREALGMTLEQVQEKTKIQKSFLVAIENGEFHKLPSPFYVRTYLRSYANCVKVEPHHILRQYRKIEQAERFGNSIHNRQPVGEGLGSLSQQMTGRMSAVGGMAGTGPQSSVSQATGRFQNAPKTGPRISVNTALTVARTESGRVNDAVQRDKELKRRNMGYQRSNVSSSLMSSPVRPGAMRPTPETGPQRIAQAQAPQMVQMPKAQQGSPVPPASVPPAPASVQAPMAGGKPENELAVPGEVKGNTLPPRRARAGQKSGMTVPPVSGGTLSRSARFRKEQTSPRFSPVPAASGTEVAPTEEPVDLDSVTQRIQVLQELSRSAVKNKKSGKSKFPLKRSAVIVVAALAVCIPLVAFGMSSVMGDKPNSKSVSSKNSADSTVKSNNLTPTSTTQQTPVQKATAFKLTQVEQGTGVKHYHLSGADQIKIVFKGVDGSCWIQIRTAFSTQNDSSLLKDVTVGNGQGWMYPYTFGDKKELWIRLGSPTSVSISINGQLVNTDKWIHIKKID